MVNISEWNQVSVQNQVLLKTMQMTDEMLLTLSRLFVFLDLQSELMCRCASENCLMQLKQKYFLWIIWIKFFRRDVVFGMESNHG